MCEARTFKDTSLEAGNEVIDFSTPSSIGDKVIKLITHRLLAGGMAQW